MNNFDKIYFKSKAVGRLSSQSLNELKSTLTEIEGSKSKLESEIKATNEQLKKQESELSWINWFPLKLFFQSKIESKKQAIAKTSEVLRKKEQDYENHTLGLEVELTDQLEAAFGTLDDRFSEVLNIKKVWDITTSQSIDRVAERTVANNVIERKEISLKRTSNSKIQCDYKALHLENANGGDLHIFPQFLFVDSGDDFALIDLLDVDVEFTLTNFIESESVPSDAEVVDHTWAMSNKDGSRDKRYTDNYQIPVVQYGELHLSSKSGLNEVYMLSHPESAFNFKEMFDEYKQVLASAGN
ncbi:hypothetical protein [Pseudoalteromonas byunsanensis]|uniref:Uncharacterized protein n=1 Tax=Pseudoalteromonas byunsanensis TaxID=327939 RepID=A0A1S1MYD7_9GAMM|nr:hypothetical protein [Pseudoalteromonas byunsanensis]OHU93795.1 hypothetical protein BIW53_16190 [Pseudoalteromonas byunsanensis]